MGRKFTVPYALYRAHGFVNPFLAQQTGFSDEDLELFFNALENSFQFDQSAARPAGSMTVRGLLVFKHDNELGKMPSHSLFDRVSVKRKSDGAPARSISDYEITFDSQPLDSVAEAGGTKDLGNGVTLIRRI
jgi:CRISPR-associated protein Csd2